MTIEERTTEKYTPFTFIGNAKRQGIREAWNIDKSLTAQRNPSLARVHGCGAATLDYANKEYEKLISNAETSLEKTVWILGYGPIRALNFLATYPLGVIGGLMGKRPEDFKYAEEPQGETQ